MNTPSADNTKTPVIVTITGPSGSGKTVLSNLLADQGMRPLVSTTTRAPRAGEIDGKHYHFISKEKFSEELASGRFIENVEYNNTFYGVSVCEAEAAFSKGVPAVLVAEPHGVQQITDYAHTRGWHVLRVFVDNPDEILIGRLFNRLLLDMGRDLPGPADVPHESFKPFLDRAVALTHQDMPEELARERFSDVLLDFLDSEDVPALPSDEAMPTAAEITKRLDAAVSRLANFRFEQINWVSPARGDKEGKLYEIVTKSFDSSVQDRVISEIMDKVHSLEQEPLSPQEAIPSRRKHSP